MALIGRPPNFERVEEIQNSIDEYFVYIEGEFHLVTVSPKEGEPYKEKVWDRPPEYPSITGLAFYLGFASRQSLYDYEERGDFSYTIKRARLKIEASYEQGLNRTSPTGAIFALKNFGWTDRSEVKHEGIPESASPTINVYNQAPPIAESEDKIQ